MVNFVDEYKTSDGYVFRVSATAFSHRRINSSKKHEIRLAMGNLLKERIPTLSLDEFVKEVTMGKMGTDMMEHAKKIAIIRHIGVRKTKLISSPLQTEDTLMNSEESVEGEELESSADQTEGEKTQELESSADQTEGEKTQELESQRIKQKVKTKMQEEKQI